MLLSLPGMWYRIISKLYMADSIQIFLAQVANVSSRDLPLFKTSTTAKLSHHILIRLLAQWFALTFHATKIFRISNCTML